MRVFLVLIVFLINGCGIAPQRAAENYHPTRYARISAQQAFAECRVEEQKYLLVDIRDCMLARGWQFQNWPN